MNKQRILNTRVDQDVLLKIKKYLDNGFNGAQTARETGETKTVVSNVRRGRYGPMPTFETDPGLKNRLKQIETEKMSHTLKLRRIRSGNKK